MPFNDASIPPLPMDATRWAAVVAQFDLSEQQARVAELVIRGLGDKAIADELGIRYGTVRVYLARLFGVTGTDSRLGLVIRLFSVALEQGRANA